MWNCYALMQRTWSFETGDPWTNGFTTNWKMQEGSRLHLCVLHARTVLDTFIVLDEISHTGLRLLQDSEIERVRDNFRLNLEILDGKIRRGEQFSDSMPLPEAVAWEDCFCVRVVCYKCSLHDGQASACVFHAAGAFRQKKRRGRLSRTCCPTQGLRRESEWSQGFSPASTQQRQPGLQSRTFAESVYAVPVHVPQDDQTETRRPIHHEGHCTVMPFHLLLTSHVFCHAQVEGQDADGYRLLFRVNELWPLLSRQQPFYNWHTKLHLDCKASC